MNSEGVTWVELFKVLEEGHELDPGGNIGLIFGFRFCKELGLSGVVGCFGSLYE